MPSNDKPWSSRVAQALKDRYHVERAIGRGGMSVVWLARDKKLKREVAIKVLDPSVSARIGTDRFLREVRITAPLQHPHILPLLDSGTVDDVVYSVMPYVEGESLRDRLEREKPLPVEEALLYAREIAEALEYAHQRGIVHRDVKPENILISGGAAVIADFGIARASHLQGDPAHTVVGTPLGTPAYMSPEQASGREVVDGRSDVYSLGVTLYEMLTGQLPFSGATEEVMRQHREEDPPSPAELRPELAPHVADLVQRAMAKRPEDRFASAGEMALALRAALGEPARQPTPPGTGTPAPRTPTPSVVRPARPWPSHASGWLVLTSLVAATFATVVLVTSAGRPRRDPAPVVTPDSQTTLAAEPALPPALGGDTNPRRAEGKSATGNEAVLARYDLGTPTSTATLAPELREASGAATLPDGRILVHGDEMAVLYVVDPATGRAEPFAEARGNARVGDYEDVAVAGRRLFLVASDGALLEWSLADPAAEPRAHPSDLGRKCDVESLAYVPSQAALLLLCKHNRLPGAEGTVLGFWWRLDQQRLDVDHPLRFDAAAMAGGTGRFSASGAAWDSTASRLLVVAGPDHRIAEVDLEGHVFASQPLDPARHPQAEGITITRDRQLVIADEGRRSGARIAVYAPAQR